MKTPTQEERIIAYLRQQEWVSTVDMVQRYILRAAARIHELNHQGYVIESRRREGQRFFEYRLAQDKAEGAAV